MACDSPVPGEPLLVFGERLRLRAETALAGSTPVDTVCALFMPSALPAAQRDKVVLHLGEDITLDQVVKTAKLVQSVPSVRVAITPVKEVSSDMKSAAAMPVAGRSKEIHKFQLSSVCHQGVDYTVLLVSSRTCVAILSCETYEMFCMLRSWPSSQGMYTVSFKRN